MMKTPLRIPSLLAASALLAVSPLFAEEKEMRMPQPSPAAGVTQTIGTNDIAIAYHRPGVKGRKIWGELVPNKEVWRTGANEATTISFSEDVVIEGQNVPAGTYALLTIPDAAEWTVILNKDSKQWGAYSYKQTEDAARFKVKPAAGPMEERMSFRIADPTMDSAKVVFTWEKVEVSFTVRNKVETATRIFDAMKAKVAAAKADDHETYANAASFCQENNFHLDEATTWIDKSIKIKETMRNHFVKAEILKKQKNEKGAATEYEKALKSATPEDSKEFKSEIQKRLDELKAKVAKG